MGTNEDRTAITETLQRYGWTIDQFDWAAVGAVFTDDADVRYGAYPPLVGGEATAAFLAGRCEGIAWHQHLVQPMQIDIDGDTATTLSYFTAHAVLEGSPDAVVMNVGEYRDRLRRTADGWRICERRQQTGWKERRDRAAADTAEIIALTMAYTWALDTKQPELLRDVFTADATADLRNVACDGIDAIITRIGSAVSRFDATQHLIGNHEVVITGNTATCRCKLQSQHTRYGFPGGENFTVGGMYLDDLVRTPHGWRISHRTLQQTWSEGNPDVLKR